MVKNLEKNSSSELETVGLTPAVSVADFQNDVTNVFLHYVRTIAWMADAETAWAITKAPKLDHAAELFNPDFNAADLGLQYTNIQATEFARAMQRMYDYAYLGQLDQSQDPLDYESIHTWIAAIVVDVAASATGREWDSYGVDILSCASRCAQVAETANARAILEGGEPFFSSFKAHSKDDYPEEAVLNVRQVSLLSGMEEMSIRAAANPNRVNQLKPIKTDSGTRFEIQVVKDWLISKKRYIPISKRWSEGDLNLDKKRFFSLDEVNSGINARFQMFCNNHGLEKIDAQLGRIGLTSGTGIGGPFLDIDYSEYKNEQKLRGLAHILELPEELLVLRVNEVIAAEQLRRIERAIKELEGQQAVPKQ